MDRWPRLNSSENDGKVVPLGTTPPPEDPPPVSRPTRLHGVAIAGMATCALIGILAMFLFITVNWTHTLGRYVIGTAFLAGIGFLSFASTAVFTAARDTYANEQHRRDGA